MGRPKDPIPEGEMDEERGCFHVEGQWECVRQNPRSIVVENVEDGMRLLIPDSQIHEDSEVYEKGTEGSLIVTAWLAREREWCD